MNTPLPTDGAAKGGVAVNFTFLVIYLAGLSAFGSFVNDMHLPSLPRMTRFSSRCSRAAYPPTSTDSGRSALPDGPGRERTRRGVEAGPYGVDALPPQPEGRRVVAVINLVGCYSRLPVDLELKHVDKR